MREVTLEASPGERKAIIGPNGAGKTTLFNLITGVFPPSSGEIILFGRDVTRWPSHRRTALGMARTFQITSLFPKLTVLDNVLLAVAGVGRTKLVMWKSLSSYRNDRKARALLETAGYWDRRDVECATSRTASSARSKWCSDWQATRSCCCSTSLPRALLGESREMAEFLKRLDPSLAILLIEHDMDVVFDVVTSISVLHFGAVVEQDRMKKSGSERVQQIYLGTG